MKQEDIPRIMHNMGKAFRASLVELYQKHGFTEDDIEFPPFYINGVPVNPPDATEDIFSVQWILEALMAKIDAQQRIIQAQKMDLTHKTERLRESKTRIKELEESNETNT